MDGDGIKAIITTAQAASDIDHGIVELDGAVYTTHKLERVIPKDPEPAALALASLTGLVGYIKADIDAVKKSGFIVHIESPTRVSFRGPLYGVANQRNYLAVAEHGGDRHGFGSYVDHETGLIYLRTRFVQDEAVKAAVALVGSIADGEVRDYSDDGVSQAVNVKVGVSRKGTEPLPNPLLLRPFRTFNDVEQPQSPFLLRLQRGSGAALPTMALFECDGGAWKSAAVANIAAYLKTSLGDGVTVIG